MKKIILLITTIVLASVSYSQNVLSLRVGALKPFQTGAAMYYGPGLSFQHGLSENIALGLNFDYNIGEVSGTSMMNIEPRFDYYFNSMFNGFHIGSNIGFNNYSLGGGFSAKALQIGINPGYTHPLSDNILLDISCGIGNNMSLETGGGSSMAIRPTLSFGYKL